MLVATRVVVDSSEPDPIFSAPGLEPEPEDSDPPPSLDALDPDELDPEPLLPLPLPLLEPVVPVSTGEDEPVDVEPASETGHTVVVTAITSVVTDPTLAGQSVTVAAHDVMV